MTLAVVLGLVVLPAAATPIIDNDHIYCWGDSFGEQFDNYAEVERGETIVLQVWVNDLNGSVDIQTGETLVNEDWQRAANGVWVCSWWDPLVVDGPLVHEHLGGTYYSAYWPYLSYNAHGSNYRYRYYYDHTGAETIRWIAEGLDVINISYTIRENAPLGLTKLGLETTFRYDLGETDTGWFFHDRIESDKGDPYAMTLNVVPEPATVGMLALGAVALLRRKR
jgi:hypothetical protein